MRAECGCVRGYFVCRSGRFGQPVGVTAGGSQEEQEKINEFMKQQGLLDSDEEVLLRQHSAAQRSAAQHSAACQAAVQACDVLTSPVYAALHGMNAHRPSGRLVRAGGVLHRGTLCTICTEEFAHRARGRWARAACSSARTARSS